MKEQLKAFLERNKIGVEYIEGVPAYQVITFKIKLVDYSTTIINKILKMQKALCLTLQVENININTDAEKGLILFEIQRPDRKTLTYNELIKDNRSQKGGLFVNMGVDTQNNIKNVNLCKFPHLLLCGTTGSGKSVLVNTFILQLLENYTPKELELILIDIKQVEFAIYENIPHLLQEPIKTLEDSRKALDKACEDMTARYEILKNSNCRNIAEYNKKGGQMKYKLIVIDELAELFLLEQNRLKSKLEGYATIEDYICRLAQLGRACGIHLIISTQRPSSDVISGLIKSNIPSRIALSVPSAVNSKIILEETGAENLTGNGDFLLKIIGTKKTERLQGAFIPTNELIERLQVIKSKYNYNNTITITPKKDILKELENAMFLIYNKSELKSLAKRNLKKFEYIQGLIDEIGTTEEEKKALNNNYFIIFNKVTQYFEGYIAEEKEAISEEKARIKEAQKVQRRDKLIFMGLINRFLHGLNNNTK